MTTCNRYSPIYPRHPENHPPFRQDDCQCHPSIMPGPTLFVSPPNLLPMPPISPLRPRWMPHFKPPRPRWMPHFNPPRPQWHDCHPSVHPDHDEMPVTLQFTQTMKNASPPSFHRDHNECQLPLNSPRPRWMPVTPQFTQTTMNASYPSIHPDHNECQLPLNSPRPRWMPAIISVN